MGYLLVRVLADAAPGARNQLDACDERGVPHAERLGDLWAVARQCDTVSVQLDLQRHSAVSERDGAAGVCKHAVFPRNGAFFRVDVVRLVAGVCGPGWVFVFDAWMYLFRRVSVRPDVFLARFFDGRDELHARGDVPAWQPLLLTRAEKKKKDLLCWPACRAAGGVVGAWLSFRDSGVNL